MDQAAKLAAAKQIVTMVRRFDAPPEALFRAWIERDQLGKWLGVPNRQTLVETLDARVGGAYRIHFAGGDMPENIVVGIFREIVPSNRLVLSWAWEAGSGGLPTEETLITVTFRAIGKETEMTLVHEGFESTEWAGRHEHGWACGFDNLAALLAA